MSSIKELASQLHRALSGLGFKRDGYRLKRQSDDALEMISIQKSGDKIDGYTKLTVNISVHLHALGALDGRKPSEWNAHWRERIGFLTEENIDKWWLLEDDNHEQLSTIASELSRLIIDRAIPAMEQVNSPLKMKAFWENDGYGELTSVQRSRLLTELTARLR